MSCRRNPRLGPIPIVGRSIAYPGERRRPPAAPPVPGRHSDAILADVLGLGPERIAALRTANVVA